MVVPLSATAGIVLTVELFSKYKSPARAGLPSSFVSSCEPSQISLIFPLGSFCLRIRFPSFEGFFPLI